MRLVRNRLFAALLAALLFVFAAMPASADPGDLIPLGDDGGVFLVDPVVPAGDDGGILPAGDDGGILPTGDDGGIFGP